MKKIKRVQKSNSPRLYDRFVKAGELAEYLPYSARKIYDLAKLEPPAIPCYRWEDAISGKPRVAFHLGEVIAWFRENRAGPSVREYDLNTDSKK